MKRIGKGVPIKIKDLFEVYKKRFRAPQSSVVNTAIEVIKDLTGITLTSDVLNYTPQSRILRINARGAMKSEIFIHREEILTHIQGRLGPQSAPKTIL
jgi:hypothetical protein